MKDHLLIFFLVLYLTNGVCQMCDKPDGLKRVEENTINEPNNFIAHVVVERSRHNYNATVSFVSKNVIIGAGHSFRNRIVSKVQGITIYIGQHTEAGVVKVISEKHYTKDQIKIWVDPLFQKRSKPEDDYAYVALPEDLCNNYFDLAQLSDLLQTDQVNISGYPGDKGNVQLWRKSDIRSNIQLLKGFMTYSIYTFEADSGAPIWYTKEDKKYLLGVHNTGGYHGSFCNGGIAFNKGRIDLLKEFIRMNSNH